MAAVCGARHLYRSRKESEAINKTRSSVLYTAIDQILRKQYPVKVEQDIDS